MKVIELHRTVTSSNDADAKKLQDELNAKGVLLVNLMSSPGSGKTTLLSTTVEMLKEDLRIAVMEADIDSDVDAIHMENLGVRSIQAHTDGMCHMDAGMTRKAIEETDVSDIDLVFLENIGNLICPAEFATGAQKNVMILSVPEGDDKPLKYPLMFQTSDVLIISKMDAIDYFDFDLEKCIERVKRLNPNIQIIPVSAKTGLNMGEWTNWLKEQCRLIKK